MQIEIEKRNHHGHTMLRYSGELIDRGDGWLCVYAVFRQPEANLGFVVFSPGDALLEWFFTDRWYNIFQLHDGDSATVKGWYCNVVRPAQLGEDTIAADDLALDVFVTPRGGVILLDEDEFAQLDLPAHERIAALRAVNDIRERVAAREAPFDILR